jgi:glyoxylase-like metal-dependent hydrolase (beta-lactamase superfamily II)
MTSGRPSIATAVHAFNPGPMTGDGNWTWLIPGAVPTLIDAGTGEPQHLAGVEEALAGGSLAQVLVTHSHTDHASGAPALAERWPGARFPKMPWPGRDDKWPAGWQPLADGDVVPAGDTFLRALHTPGHAPDHLCFWHEPTRTLLSGDLAIKGTTVWIPASLRGDLAAYLRSLEHILALEPERLLPAHGSVIEEPAALLRGYIAHRMEREGQVLEALRAGDRNAEEMVARMYRGLGEKLRPLARESIEAHLVKLEQDGRARRTSGPRPDGDADRRANDEAWHIIEA